MKPLLALLAVLAATAASAQPTPTPARDRFPTALASSVFATGLRFMAPRTLEPVPVPQLALWGLRGITAADPALLPVLQDGTLRLLHGDQVLFQRPAPADAAAEQWGTAVSEVLAAAWLASPALRQAGAQAGVTGFFDEVFSHLDPYSRYVPPGAADADRARRSGEAGIGVQVARLGANFVVAAIVPDSPAAEAGLRIGERIEAVDDQPVQGEELETVRDWIAGAEGAEVTLSVRGRDGRLRLLDIERTAVPADTVFPARSGGLLLLRISGFNRDTDQRLARELQRALSGPGGRAVRGIVLDLRGNRGGLLRQAVAATDMLLDTGLIATTAGRNPEAAHEWRAGSGDVSAGRPMAVLVDGRSASAAEVMAAALADRGRAVVIGSATLGKGLVQTKIDLPDGGELFVSWSRVLAPAGWPIQGLGVLPQVCTSLGGEQLAQQIASLDRGELRTVAALARHRAARAPLPAAEVVELRAACPAAEGRDADLATARTLLARPRAYDAARLPAP